MRPYYESDGITIYHGDCFEVLPSGVWFGADLMLTDPPYGLGHRLAGGGWGSSDKDGLPWDRKAPDVASIVHLAREAIVWGGNFFTLPPRRGWLSWRKSDAVPTMGRFELAWTTLDIPMREFAYPIAAVNAERNGHPTLKPRKLMEWCIGLADNPSFILDPFMGSGTTLVAARNLNRRAIGIEIEERYCEIAAERLSQQVLAL